MKWYVYPFTKCKTQPSMRMNKLSVEGFTHVKMYGPDVHTADGSASHNCPALLFQPLKVLGSVKIRLAANCLNVLFITMC